jgi:hypothetical protein
MVNDSQLAGGALFSEVISIADEIRLAGQPSPNQANTPAGPRQRSKSGGKGAGKVSSFQSGGNDTAHGTGAGRSGSSSSDATCSAAPALENGEDAGDKTIPTTRDLLDLGPALELQGPFDWIDANTPLQPNLTANWLVRGVIPTEGLGVIYGRPGCGKSFVVLDLGMRIAANKTWHGARVEQRTVAYVASEAGSSGTNRIVAWQQDHPGCRSQLRMTTATLDLRSTRNHADALIAELQRWKAAGREVGLVIIDTLNRAMAGGDENSSQDMGAFIANCDYIAKGLKCFVMIVHHSGKKVAAGGRGHSSLLGAVDIEIEVTRDKDGPGKLTVTKSRDGKDGSEYGFDLKVLILGKDQDGDDVTSCVAIEVATPTKASGNIARLTPPAETALDALRVVLADKGKTGHMTDNLQTLSVTMDDWRAECYRRADFSEGGKDRGRKAFQRARERLQDHRLISDKDGRVWIISPASD